MSEDIPKTNVADQTERQSTDQVLEDIAVEFSRPLSEVQKILKVHLDRVDRQAHIKQYVSLLAIKQLKEVLKENTSIQRAPEKTDQP